MYFSFIYIDFILKGNIITSAIHKLDVRISAFERGWIVYYNNKPFHVLKLNENKRDSYIKVEFRFVDCFLMRNEKRKQLVILYFGLISVYK